MALRRARIQIKPNLRATKPAAATTKTSDTSKSKIASVIKSEIKAESSAEAAKPLPKAGGEKAVDKAKSVDVPSQDVTDGSAGAKQVTADQEVSQDGLKSTLRNGDGNFKPGADSAAAETPSLTSTPLSVSGTPVPADSKASKSAPAQSSPAVGSGLEEVQDAGKTGTADVPILKVTGAGDSVCEERSTSSTSASTGKSTPGGSGPVADQGEGGFFSKKGGTGDSAIEESIDLTSSKSVDQEHSKSLHHAHTKAHEHAHSKVVDHSQVKSVTHTHAHSKASEQSHVKAVDHGGARGTDHGPKGTEGPHKADRARPEARRFDVSTLRKRRTPVDKQLLPSTDEPPPKTLKMRELIHWNPRSNPMSTTTSGKGKAKKKKPETTPETQATVDELDDVNRNLAAPRVAIGPDGNFTIDDNVFQEKNLIDELPTVEEDENEVLNSHSFRKNRTLTKYWTERETAKFYIALSMVGTDFTLMQSELFTKRTRKELKNKFKREEKLNRNMVDIALKHKQPINKSVFIVEEVDEEAEKERRREERRKKRQEKAEAQRQQQQEREARRKQSLADKAQQQQQQQLPATEQRKSGRKRRMVRQDDYVFDDYEEDMELEESAPAATAKDPRTEVGEILVNMSQQGQAAAAAVPGAGARKTPQASTAGTLTSSQKSARAPRAASLPRLAPAPPRHPAGAAARAGAATAAQPGAARPAAVGVQGQAQVPEQHYLRPGTSSGTITHQGFDASGNPIQIHMPQEALMNLDGARMIDQVINTPQGPSTQRLLLLPENTSTSCVVHIYVLPQDATISIFEASGANMGQRLMDLPPSTLDTSVPGLMHLYNVAYPRNHGNISVQVQPRAPAPQPPPPPPPVAAAVGPTQQQQLVAGLVAGDVAAQQHALASQTLQWAPDASTVQFVQVDMNPAPEAGRQGGPGGVGMDASLGQLRSVGDMTQAVVLKQELQLGAEAEVPAAGNCSAADASVPLSSEDGGAGCRDLTSSHPAGFPPPTSGVGWTPSAVPFVTLAPDTAEEAKPGSMEGCNFLLDGSGTALGPQGTGNLSLADSEPLAHSQEQCNISLASGETHAQFKNELNFLLNDDSSHSMVERGAESGRVLTVEATGDAAKVDESRPTTSAAPTASFTASVPTQGQAQVGLAPHQSNTATPEVQHSPLCKVETQAISRGDGGSAGVSQAQQPVSPDSGRTVGSNPASAVQRSDSTPDSSYS